MVLKTRVPLAMDAKRFGELFERHIGMGETTVVFLATARPRQQNKTVIQGLLAMPASYLTVTTVCPAASSPGAGAR